MPRNILLSIALVMMIAREAPASPAAGDLLEAFVAEHGPGTLVRTDSGGHLTFAGRFSSAPVVGPPDLAALGFVERWAPLMGIDSVAELVVADARTLGGLAYVRLDQEHGGVPVEGAGVVVTLDASGCARQVSSSLVGQESWAAPVPTIGPEQARAWIAGSLPLLAPTGQVRLAYVPALAGPVRLAWVMRTHSLSGPEAPEVYVDAHGGGILAAIDTNVYADGNVYASNPTADPTVVRTELPFLESTTGLDGTYAHSFSCTAPDGSLCPGRVRHAAPDGDGHYLFSPDEPSLVDPFSEVMGYYHLDRVNRHMEDAYGHVFSCEGNRWMDITVNMDYENAWFGDQDDDGCRDITVGQGTYDFAYDSAIIYHEFGHGINATYSDLRRDFDDIGPDFSGNGLNEAFADYWAASYIGRPVIGEYASLGDPGELGFRDLTRDASCPGDLYGESHYDGPVMSTTLWDIRESIGMDKTDRLALAILASISDRPDFDEAGMAALSQASALESAGVLTSTDVSVVDAAVAAHTLVGCRRIVPLEDGETHMFIFPAWRGGYDTAGGLQFSLHAPETATRVSAVIDQYTSEGGYTVYVRRDANVTFAHEGPDTWVVDYDFVFAGSPDRVSFTEWSDPVLEPGTTYHYAIMHNADIMALGVEAIIVAPEPTDAESDAGEDAAPDPHEDVTADIPLDPEDDAGQDATGDPGDVRPEPGAITATNGCGCTLVR